MTDTRRQYKSPTEGSYCVATCPATTVGVYHRGVVMGRERPTRASVVRVISSSPSARQHKTITNLGSVDHKARTQITFPLGLVAPPIFGKCRSRVGARKALCFGVFPHLASLTSGERRRGGGYPTAALAGLGGGAGSPGSGRLRRLPPSRTTPRPPSPVSTQCPGGAVGPPLRPR